MNIKNQQEIKNKQEIEGSTISNGWLDKCTLTQKQKLQALRLVTKDRRIATQMHIQEDEDIVTSMVVCVIKIQ